VPLILVVGLLSQPLVVTALSVTPGWRTDDNPGALKPADRCLQARSFATLKRLPRGLVLGEIDLGPRILAQTPHSAVAAPYHRMSWGILAAHGALSAPPGQDERAARRLGVDYVVTCPARERQVNHRLGPRSLQVRLDKGQAPPWLEAVSAPDAPMQVYRVRKVALGG
jgi:hypothetical protein